MSLWTQPILEINLQNLLQNYQTLQKAVGQAVCAAVVKDDAYGLRAVEVAPYLYQYAGCRHFFVAHAVEGEQIAPLLPEAKIYVLQGVGEDSLPLFGKIPNLIPVISTPQMLAAWKASSLAKQPAVIQIETGLNRLGFREDDLAKLTQKQRQGFCMVMSHLACADDPTHFMNDVQYQNFERLKKQYFPDLPASLSASDGVFLGANYAQSMVRLGAAMYGINTTPYRENRMKNVVTIKAPVLQVVDVPAGQYVGYGASYQAQTLRKLAVVSIGYGDGLPRALSNRGQVFFRKDEQNYAAPIMGRVCMDNVMCDVTDIPDLKEGDTAFLCADFYTLDDMAKAADTIAYELISRFGKNPRFKRCYTRKMSISLKKLLKKS